MAGWGAHVWLGVGGGGTTIVEVPGPTVFINQNSYGISKARICNMALGHVGSSAFLANLETDKGKEATVCRMYYEPAVDACLRAFDWPFATGYRATALVSDSVGDDWQYAYRYPTDALKIRRIVTALGRKDPNPPPFVVGQDSQGQLIYTSERTPTFEYTVRVTDPSRFDPLFVAALAYWLASDIAPSLSRIKGMQDDALKKAMLLGLQAEGIASGEQQHEPAPDSEFVRARA